MGSYFSFQKLITKYFVRTIYTLGFVVLTVGGVGFAISAGRRLNAGALPTRTAVWFICAGAAVALVGNLVWRLICEFWILLFNMHAVLVSIAQGTKPLVEQEELPGKAAKREAKAEPPNYGLAPRHSVLGLS